MRVGTVLCVVRPYWTWGPKTRKVVKDEKRLWDYGAERGCRRGKGRQGKGTELDTVDSILGGGITDVLNIAILMFRTNCSLYTHLFAHRP